MNDLAKGIIELGNKSKGLGCLALILILILAFILILIETAIGAWLWGIIAVKIFGAPALTFWQFFGLTWLLHILLPGRSVSSNSSSKD